MNLKRHLNLKFRKKTIIHRKGAIRAGEDELGIIPRAMGSNSYIVAGKG
ncbi:MAG: RtcB family protein [Flavobacteriales bacterium]|nr:RtcB family protein [Flavobacteriales bacterium]